MATFHSGKNVQDAETVQCRPEYRKGKAYSRRFHLAVRQGQTASPCSVPCCQCRHRAAKGACTLLLHKKSPLAAFLLPYCAHSACKEMSCEYIKSQALRLCSFAQCMSEDLQNSTGQQFVFSSRLSENNGQHHTNTASYHTWLGPRSGKILTILAKDTQLHDRLRSVVAFLKIHNIPHDIRLVMQSLVDPDGKIFGNDISTPY